MGLALREIGSIPEIAFSPPPLYIAITSGLWAVIFGVCLGAVLLNLRWGALAAILAGVLNQAHVWLDWLLFSLIHGVHANPRLCGDPQCIVPRFALHPSGTLLRETHFTFNFTFKWKQLTPKQRGCANCARPHNRVAVPNKIAAQRARGRLTARDRIEAFSGQRFLHRDRCLCHKLQRRHRHGTAIAHRRCHHRLGHG